MRSNPTLLATPPPHLLGCGLDAIVDTTRSRWPVAPTPLQRLARYRDAVMLAGSDDMGHREVRGARVQFLAKFTGKERRAHLDAEAQAIAKAAALAVAATQSRVLTLRKPMSAKDMHRWSK